MAAEQALPEVVREVIALLNGLHSLRTPLNNDGRELLRQGIALIRAARLAAQNGDSVLLEKTVESLRLFATGLRDYVLPCHLARWQEGARRVQ